MPPDVRRFRDAEQRLWQHLGATPEERWVTLASGGRVRVQELGEGPPFVLLHGAAIAGASWAHLAVALDGVRCVMVDRPGCGLSDPIVGGPLCDLAAVVEYADRLLPDLLDALELPEAAVGATSYGGYFAIRGAAAAPHRVTRLVEYSFPIGAPIASVPFAARLQAVPGMRSLMTRMPMTRGMVRSALRQFGLRRAIASGAFDDVAIDWAYALLRHTETLANDSRSSPKLFTPIRGQNRDALLDDATLARLTMPMLFLWGADDPNGGADVATTFASRLPNAELVVVPGAEHGPWLDDPRTCVDRTRSFLLGRAT